MLGIVDRSAFASQVISSSLILRIAPHCQNALSLLSRLRDRFEQNRAEKRHQKKRRVLGAHLRQYLDQGWQESKAIPQAEIDLLVTRGWNQEIAQRLQDQLSEANWWALVYQSREKPQYYYRGINIAADRFRSDPGSRIWVSNDYSKAKHYTTADQSSFIIRYQFSANLLLSNPHNRVCADGGGSFCISERIPEFTVIEALPTNQLLFADAIQFPNLSEEWIPLEQVYQNGQIIAPTEPH